MDEEKLKETFLMNNGNQEDEDLYILDTYENKKKIVKILQQKYPSCHIKEFKGFVRNNDFFISKIIVFIDNISNVL